MSTQPEAIHLKSSSVTIRVSIALSSLALSQWLILRREGGREGGRESTICLVTKCEWSTAGTRLPIVSSAGLILKHRVERLQRFHLFRSLYGREANMRGREGGRERGREGEGEGGREGWRERWREGGREEGGGTFVSASFTLTAGSARTSFSDCL